MKIAQSLLQAFEAYKTEVESPEYQPFAQPVREVARLPEPTKPPSSPEYLPKAELAKQPSSSAPKRVFTNIYQATPEQPATVPVKKASTPSKVEAEKRPILFFVQLAASSKPQATNTPRWRSLGYPIEVIKEEELYKYRARNFNDLAAAQKAKDDLRTKGFPDAFVVAYRGKDRISITQAIQQSAKQ